MYAEHVASISGHASPKPSLLCRQLASGGCEQVVRQPTTLLSLSPLSLGVCQVNAERLTKT